jgi:hypothetical protein
MEVTTHALGQLRKRRDLVGDLPLFLLDEEITLDHQLAVQRVVDEDLPLLDQAVSILERIGCQQVTAYEDCAHTTASHVRGGDPVALPRSEWCEVCDLLTRFRSRSVPEEAPR